MAPPHPLAALPVARPSVLAPAVGVPLGAVCHALNAVLPPGWATLASTSALWGWAVAAIVVALRVRVRAAPWAGAGAMVAMVAGDVLGQVLAGSSPALGPTLLRAAAAVLAGAGCGLAGACARSGAGRGRALALACLGGLVAGEGGYGIALAERSGAHWWAELVLGLALPLSGGGRWRAGAVLGALALAVVVVAGCVAYDTAMDHLL